MTINWTPHVSPEDLINDWRNPIVIALSDGRKIHAHQFADVSSVMISVIGPKGATRECFILDRQSLEKILALTKEI